MSEELVHTVNNFDGKKNPNNEIINMSSLKIVSIKHIENLNAFANNSSCTNVTDTDADTVNLSVHVKEEYDPGVTKDDGNDTKHQHYSEDSHFRGFDPLPTRDWVINESWLKLPNHVFNEGIN